MQQQAQVRVPKAVPLRPGRHGDLSPGTVPPERAGEALVVGHPLHPHVAQEEGRLLREAPISMRELGGARLRGSEGGPHRVDKARSGEVPEDFPDDNMQKAITNALTLLEELKNEFPGLTVIDTETKIKLPVKSIFSYQKDDLMFTGKLDVVLKHNDGYLIIDFKTDKDTNYSDSHKRQLALYKKMYATSESIPEDEIKTCVIYIALRGNIETGKYDGEKQIGTRNVFSTVERHFEKILGWRADPGKFIDDFISLSSNANSVKNDETLFFSLKELLEKSITSSQ